MTPEEQALVQYRLERARESVEYVSGLIAK
jgi:hypothetical protein